jgi:FkbM family methyltransferase
MSETVTVHAALWRSSRLKSTLALCAYPIFLMLNRPSLGWLADLLYDVALRCCGIAITFAGKQGLTRAEEHFLIRVKDRLQGGVLLDIGANHGAYANALHQLAPTARIFAFEPHPLTFSLLQSHLRISPSVLAINKAVADRPGRLTLYDFQSTDGSTQASLCKTAVALYSSDLVEYPVDCTTVDAFMAEMGLDYIDLLKIDTEGRDLSVLKGAQNALQNRKVGMIQFEFIPANIAAGVTMHAFFTVLQGYQIGRLRLNGSVRWLDHYDVKRCEIYVTQNLIAIPLGSDQIISPGKFRDGIFNRATDAASTRQRDR